MLPSDPLRFVLLGAKESIPYGSAGIEPDPCQPTSVLRRPKAPNQLLFSLRRDLYQHFCLPIPSLPIPIVQTQISLSIIFPASSLQHPASSIRRPPTSLLKMAVSTISRTALRRAMATQPTTWTQLATINAARTYATPSKSSVCVSRSSLTRARQRLTVLPVTVPQGNFCRWLARTD